MCIKCPRLSLLLQTTHKPHNVREDLHRLMCFALLHNREVSSRWTPEPNKSRSGASRSCPYEPVDSGRPATIQLIYQ
jgi:hypothetical protein